jgi:hypothetical protein
MDVENTAGVDEAELGMVVGDGPHAGRVSLMGACLRSVGTDVEILRLVFGWVILLWDLTMDVTVVVVRS